MFKAIAITNGVEPASPKSSYTRLYLLAFVPYPFIGIAFFASSLS